MASRGGWPGHAEQAAAEQALAQGGMWPQPAIPLDMPQRGRQVHREPPAPLPACGSWQQGGGPSASGGGQTRSLSAPPAELAERWAGGQAAHTLREAEPQPGGWQHAPRQEPSTHFSSQVLPLLAEAPAQPSPSTLLPVEQQQWLKRRLEQAQQQLARQRHEQAEWAAAAAQLLRGRTQQAAPAHLAAPAEEPWCPTCRASGQDSTEATESQQLEDLIDGLEIEMEQELEELQRRQRWAAQHPQAHQGWHHSPGHQLPASHPRQLPTHQLPAHRQHQLATQPADPAWGLQRQQQEQEHEAMLRLDQEQWQQAAAAAMQVPPHGAQPVGQLAASQPFAMAPPFGGSGYSAPDECPAPVRLSAPARMEQHWQVSYGTASDDPSLLLNRAWQQQQQQRRQHSWHQQQPPLHQQQQQQQQLQQPQPQPLHWQQQQQQQRQQAQLPHQQVAPQRLEPASQPWQELTHMGAQLQAEQQQWAAHARELLARSSAGPAPSWR